MKKGKKKTKKQVEEAEKQFEKMEIINFHSAGIDVGSRSHYVATGQTKEDVREFGVYTSDLHELCKYLTDKGVLTVALESTGSYWQPLFVMLQEYKLNPILVNGKFTKNVKGKKTDVQDCQHIQRMHSLGLLEGSFLPDLFTETLRQYYRHRQALVISSSRYINKIQKSLRLTNIRLDAVLRDVMGRSGRDIIDAILSGERNAERLSGLVQPGVKASQKEITEALTGDWREEYIFELRQCYEIYNYYHQKIEECDKEIEKLILQEIEQKQKAAAEEEEEAAEEAAAEEEEKGKSKQTKKVKIKKKKVRKNEADINLQQLFVSLSGGVDISKIDGLGLGFLLCLLSETGVELSAFPTAKQFASWLRLTPDIRKTGGKVISSYTGKNKNRLARAFIQAANAIGNKKTGDSLFHFFKRVEHRKGRIKATVATARKLSVIVWNMLVKKTEYMPMQTKEYLDKIRRRQIQNMQRKIKQLNIKQNELCFAND
jgi:transposase